MGKDSQRRQILAALLEGVSLTGLDALNMFGCIRMGARISELRNQFNYPIKGRWIAIGDKKRIVQYYIDEEDRKQIKGAIRERSEEATGAL